MMEAARAARGHDLDAIGALASGIVGELGDHRGGDVFFRREGALGVNPTHLDMALGSDAHIVVVGLFAEVVLGYGLATVDTLSDGTKLGRLEALVVHAEARGVGIGEVMMNLVLDELRRNGCISVDSQALPGDRHTKNFFESFGLKARLLTVNKTL